MQTVRAYAQKCRMLSKEDFCDLHAHPFIVRAAVHQPGTQKLTDSGRAITVDMLVLEDPDSTADAAGPEDWYLVHEVISEDPEAERVSIGRDESCDVVVDEPSVSRLHAWIAIAKYAAYIEDADSSAGTAVNDETVHPKQPAKLESGNRISVGNVELLYMSAEDFYTFARRLLG